MSSIAAVRIESVSHRDQAAVAAILALLRERTGIDFSHYRPSTIRRRILNRMISVGANTFEHYLGILRANEGESVQLLQRVTIKVSRFYRNASTFDVLRHQAIPELARRRAGVPLRIWSAGCGCGEEPYTLAMLLEEAGAPGIVEATDIDPTALHAAKLAHYSDASLTELPSVLRERYLEAADDRSLVCESIRRRVRFSHHDLASQEDPPGAGSLFDLVCCRNVLIYFDQSIQEQAMRGLRRAVRSGGYLCLGESEWPMPSIAAYLDALPHRTRVFRASNRCVTWKRE